MKLLITGGAGFIGSNLVRLALRRGHEVLNIDKLTYAGNPTSLSDLETDPRYQFLHADICDVDAMRAAFAEFLPDAVMHLAAESHVDRSIDGPMEFVRTNVVGTVTLLEVATEYWRSVRESEGGGRTSEVRDQKSEVGDQRPETRSQKSEVGSQSASSPSPIAHLPSSAAQRPHLQSPQKSFRFLHVSTDEVYGSLGDTGAFTETTSYDPHSPYSASKASSDHFVRAWHDTYGLPTLITNCSNNYGPYQFPEKLIPVAILKALRGDSIPVYGKGENVRDWLYVEDHAEALLTVLEKGRVGETYNIGGNNEMRNIDLVRLLCRILDREMGDRGSEMEDGRWKIGGTDQNPLSGGAAVPDLPSSNFDLRTPSESLITFVTDRPGHDLRYAIDASKIRDELGWTPKQDHESGFRKTVRWYLENEAWWQRVLSGDYRLERLGGGFAAGNGR